MTTTPGWYDDGHGALRWWDGTQWTEHVAQPDAESSPAPTEAEIVAEQLGFEHQPAGATEPGIRPSAAGVPSTVPGHAGAPGQPEVSLQPPYAAAQQHPSAGPGYAQGGAPAGGGFTAATEPRTSKLWIVWVVLGVVLLGMVIAAAVVIPLLVLSASHSAGGAQSDGERAAVATVELYDDAWQNGDCEAFAAATTEFFRTENGFADCATFEEESGRFDEYFADYELTVTDVQTEGDEIVVTTSETFMALVDGNGDPADPTADSTVYQYTLVQADGAWTIDALTYE